MYFAMLVLHSLLRWAVVLTGLITVARAFTGNGKRPWTAADNRASLWFTIALDVQLLVGLLLYAALSPLTRLALQDFAGAMRDPGLRFWAVEHTFGMVLAIVLAHVGRVRIRKAATDARRYHAAMVFFTIALIAILMSVPWPGMPNARPLLRW